MKKFYYFGAWSWKPFLSTLSDRVRQVYCTRPIALISVSIFSTFDFFLPEIKIISAFRVTGVEIY